MTANDNDAAALASFKRGEELTFELLRQFAAEDLIISEALFATLTILLHCCFDAAPTKKAVLGMLGVAMSQAAERVES